MKTLKAICTAAILALILTVPAQAGEISTPGVTSNGDVSTPGYTQPVPETEPDAGEISTPGFLDILWAVASIY
jgi:hypothetical protein